MQSKIPANKFPNRNPKSPPLSRENIGLKIILWHFSPNCETLLCVFFFLFCCDYFFFWQSFVKFTCHLSTNLAVCDQLVTVSESCGVEFANFENSNEICLSWSIFRRINEWNCSRIKKITAPGKKNTHNKVSQFGEKFHNCIIIKIKEFQHRSISGRSVLFDFMFCFPYLCFFWPKITCFYGDQTS